MLRKHILFIFSLFIVCLTTTSFTMHRAVFRALQITAGGYCIKKGCEESYYDYKTLQKPIPHDERKIQGRIRKWVHTRMIELGTNPIPLFLGEGWSILQDQAMKISLKDTREINKILTSKSLLPEKYNKEATSDNKLLALNGMFRDHEISHYIRQDSHRKVLAPVMSAILVQGICSYTAFLCNKIITINPPKTSLGLFIRSPFIAASIPLKLFLARIAEIKYARHCELEADRFACIHAESFLALQSYKDFWQEQEDWLQDSLLHNPVELLLAKKLTDAQVKNLIKDHCAFEHYSQKANEETDPLTKKFNTLMLELTLESAHLCLDVDHPRPKHRADLVQKYIDTWKEKA